MKPIVALLLVSALGCGKKREAPYAYSSGDGSEDGEEGTESNGQDDGSAPVDCGDEWSVVEDGIALQPENCLSWSPLSLESMDWYSAASVEDGELGGCESDCPEGDGHCTTLELGGRSSWRLPSFNELKEAARSGPNIPDMDAKLWSRDTGQGAPGNAWVVDLSQAGFYVELDKEDDGIWVRCVSEG